MPGKIGDGATITVSRLKQGITLACLSVYLLGMVHLGKQIERIQNEPTQSWTDNVELFQSCNEVGGTPNMEPVFVNGVWTFRFGSCTMD